MRRVILAVTLFVAAAATAERAGATPIMLQGFAGISGPSLVVGFDTDDAVRTGFTTNVSGPSAWSTGSGWTNFRTEQFGSPSAPGAVAMGGTRLQMIDVGVFGPGVDYNSSVRYPSFSGNLDQRGSLVLGWGEGIGSPNAPGMDLLVLEWGNNEGFWIELMTASGWTGPRYVPAQLALRAGLSPTGAFRSWGTLVDYAWFGLPAGTFIRQVRLTSVLVGDRGVSTDGGVSFAFDPQGVLIVNPQTGQPFSYGPIPPYYTSSDLTADVWYAVSLSGAGPIGDVPEPSSLLLVSAGLSALGAMRRRLISARGRG